MWFPTPNWIRQRLLQVDGAGSGIDSDKLDGMESTAFALAGHTHGGGGLAGFSRGIPIHECTVPNSGGATIEITEGNNFVYRKATFANAATESLYAQVAVPSGYLGVSLDVHLWWIASANSGNVLWALEHRKNPGSGAWDNILDGPQTLVQAVPGITGDLKRTTITITPDLDEGAGVVTLRLYRMGTDGLDSFTGTASVVMLLLEESTAS